MPLLLQPLVLALLSNPNTFPALPLLTAAALDPKPEFSSPKTRKHWFYSIGPNKYLKTTGFTDPAFKINEKPLVLQAKRPKTNEKPLVLL